MGDTTSTQMGFADLMVSQRKGKASFLDDVDRLVDWRPIEKILHRTYKKKASADGRPAYPALPLFKMLLIQRWYNLSDAGLEEAVNDRISFLRFTGFSLENSIPDETTICRFRNELGNHNLFEKLLDKINEQLQSKHLLVRTGAIVDAGLVTSARRPRKVIEVMPEDRKEEESAVSSDCKLTYSDDIEAAWVRKGNRPHYGYKMHMATDRAGFVLGGHVTPANISDTGEFIRLVHSLDLQPCAAVLADKGYASAKNRGYLQDRGYTDGIMTRAVRGRSLTEEETARNKSISLFRYVVEQTFGTLKRRYGLFRARYVGRLKTEAEMLLCSIALNLRKAATMLS
jgi:transposase, IS5 family